MTKKQRTLEIIERLKQEYPDSDCTLDYDQAWKLLVSVRLAAQCTDARSPMGICSAARAETTVSATMAARSSPSRMMGARTPRTTVPNILSINKGPLSDFPPGGGHFIHNGIIIIENRRQVKKSPAPFLRAGAVFLLFLRGFGPSVQRSAIKIADDGDLPGLCVLFPFQGLFDLCKGFVYLGLDRKSVV